MVLAGVLRVPFCSPSSGIQQCDESKCFFHRKRYMLYRNKSNNLKHHFIYLFLAVLGAFCCCLAVSLAVASGDPSLASVRGLLTAAAPLVVERGSGLVGVVCGFWALQHRLSRCGAWA